MSKSWTTVALTLVGLLGISAAARAQSAIAGVVKDSSDAALPGVTVVAEQRCVDSEKSRSTCNPTAAANTRSWICGREATR